MSAIELTDDFLEAAHELRYCTAEIAKLTEQKKRCTDLLAKHLTVGDNGVDDQGNVLVKVQKGAATFKAELAIANLPAHVLDTIMTTAPDAKKAKDVLAPALYALCTQDNNPTIKAA